MKAMLKSLMPGSVRRPLRRALSRLTSRAPIAAPLNPDRARLARERFAQVDWQEAAERRAVYALTPTADLRNIGDHAQAVAIRAWLEKHYPDSPIVELDKDMAIACHEEIRARVRPSDRVFLHSGGNLGDRGRWSEGGRRLMIAGLRHVPVVSLPQTIHFSDTPSGRAELNTSQHVYGRHPDLTVLGRDAVSGALAAKLFPRARTGTYPDFVLSLSASAFDLEPNPAHAGKLLACLRLDNESVFDPEGRQRLFDRLGRSATLFDTTLPDPIPPELRRATLRETLNLFAGHDLVVTDRYHGLIFAVICRKPAVVLRTVDHKLTSAIEWFSGIPNVIFCESAERIREAVEEAKAVPDFDYPDFNGDYFDRLPDWLRGESASTVAGAAREGTR
ncbi:polysaccharide pyruvyl transferase family protein [Sphingosinicella terrae]|uniref:polysaccharide pyruvyl transferase family protein n=1 Tax=Sphingosinicella terrae TaxID=2172047 RepID=UPI000E0D5FAD|nr:polysaccharide pyruvyl transferase family protein [Sphingosinicella terrae]